MAKHVIHSAKKKSYTIKKIESDDVPTHLQLSCTEGNLSTQKIKELHIRVQGLDNVSKCELSHPDETVCTFVLNVFPPGSAYILLEREFSALVNESGLS
jgi:hypothetical protein